MPKYTYVIRVKCMFKDSEKITLVVLQRQEQNNNKCQSKASVQQGHATHTHIYHYIYYFLPSDPFNHFLIKHK